MNLDAQTAIDAQREWDATRREEHNHARLTGEHCQKLVVTPAWKLRLVREIPRAQPYTGRWAACPRCGAGPSSPLLLAFFPGMIEERPGEECDLYIHQCILRSKGW